MRPTQTPTVRGGGDSDADGDNDATDLATFDTWRSLGVYDVRGDLDLDGDLDGADRLIIVSISISSPTMGRGVLSRSAVGNTRGYAGYGHLRASKNTHG